MAVQPVLRKRLVMPKYYLFVYLSILIFVTNNVNAQSSHTNRLKLEVRCFDSNYRVNYGLNGIRPSFILAICNIGASIVSLNQDVLFGHSGDENHNDITFELMYLSGTGFY